MKCVMSVLTSAFVVTKTLSRHVAVVSKHVIFTLFVIIVKIFIDITHKALSFIVFSVYIVSENVKHEMTKESYFILVIETIVLDDFHSCGHIKETRLYNCSTMIYKRT